ncbi:TPA: hypothetical protein ACP7R1_002999 [Escherichia coli]
MAGTSLPWMTETGCGRVCSRKVRLRRTGRNAAAGRQRELRHQAQWPYTPSGVQGAPHPARPEKTGSTTMACRGHWRTTPVQVKTEKTARHP